MHLGFLESPDHAGCNARGFRPIWKWEILKPEIRPKSFFFGSTFLKIVIFALSQFGPKRRQQIADTFTTLGTPKTPRTDATARRSDDETVTNAKLIFPIALPQPSRHSGPHAMSRVASATIVHNFI